jgi:hypothetical protein
MTSPVLTFQVNLELNTTEAIGPNTNLVNPHILHPMRYQTDQDNAQTEQSNIKNTRGLWLPGLSGANNISSLGHGERFTVRGLQAIYIRDTYTTGVVGDATSTPLYIYSDDPADAVDNG